MKKINILSGLYLLIVVSCQTKTDNKIDQSLESQEIVSEDEYEKVKQVYRQKLINENKKVDISLKGRNIEDGIVDCYEIISTEKVNGKTF